MNKAYKYRIYPNEEQKVLFAKTFGCVRFIYNKMLSDKIEHYKLYGTMLQNAPAQYKEEYEWLKEVDSLALCNAQQNLKTAYKNFFERPEIGFPKFKSKKSGKNSYTTNNQNGTVAIVDRCLKLPKVGLVKIRMHRQIPKSHKIKSVTISRDSSGKYYASILAVYEAEPPAAAVNPDKALGLDYSSPHFYVDSNGYAADMPHYYREAEKSLAKAQRKLSKMVKGSANYQKQKCVVAKKYAKVRNQRKDWQHKESRRLADQWDIICVEDINMQNMAQSLKLGKSTNDNGFGQFRTFLSYKLQEQGKQLITINKWFPSSKLCRHCGSVNKDLQLTDREWTCPNCGAHIDRDWNAAINIRNEGLAMLSA